MQGQNSEIRCRKCGAKLAEASFSDGFVSIKCRCGVINKVTAETSSEGTEAIIPLDRLPEILRRGAVPAKEKREFPPGGMI